MLGACEYIAQARVNMPDFSAAAKETYAQVSIQLRDFTGQSRSAALARANPAVTGGQVDTLRTAIGNMSNARVMSESANVVEAIINPADPLNTVFDEAYSTVNDAIILVFQNATGDVQRLRVPAPDLSIFQPDGETVDLTNGLFTATRDAALAVLPTGYIFSRVYLEGLGKRVRVPLPTAEPLSTDSPPQLPASEPVE